MLKRLKDVLLDDWVEVRPVEQVNLVKETLIKHDEPMLRGDSMTGLMTGSIPYDEIQFDRGKGHVDFMRHGRVMYRMTVAVKLDVLILRQLKGDIEVTSMIDRVELS